MEITFNMYFTYTFHMYFDDFNKIKNYMISLYVKFQEQI